MTFDGEKAAEHMRSFFDENNVEADIRLRKDLGGLDYKTCRLLNDAFDGEDKDDSPEYTKRVNLGGCNGAKWASLNFGANRPTQVGAYLSYEDCCLIKEHWKGKWELPSKDDFNSLLRCSFELRMDYQDVIGVQIKGNNNSIFVPLSGFKLSGQDEKNASNHIFLWGKNKMCFHLECNAEIVKGLKRHERIMLHNIANIVEMEEEGMLLPARPLWI